MTPDPDAHLGQAERHSSCAPPGSLGASVGGIPVPVTVLREVVSYYTKTDVDPEGFDLTEPFDLPYGVTDVTIESARAVVVQ